MPITPSPDRQILEAFRTRLETLDGVTVYLGKSIDPEHDVLPAVTAVMAEPQEQSSRDAPPEILWRAVFDFQGDIKVPGPDPLAELMDYARRIRFAVYRPEDRSLGGLASDHWPMQTQLFAPAPSSIIGSVLIRIAVDFVEDFYND